MTTTDRAGYRAVVTGATGTVGVACVRALARQGCAVSLVGRRPEALAELAAELTDAGASVETVELDFAERFDFTVPSSWSGERLVLVNAAAVYGPLQPVAEVDPDAWADTLQVNLLAPVRLITALLPAMLDQHWGRVVQISSAAAVDVPGPFSSAYAVSKSALNRTLAHLATELAGSGVTVHALHPGEIRSAMWADIARQSADRPDAGFADWVERTRTHGEDPDRVGEWLVALLDDEVAAGLDGRFAWPQTGAPPTALTAVGLPKP